MAALYALYVHVPLCPYVCPYCDFAKGPYREDRADAYLRGLALELDLLASGQGPSRDSLPGLETPKPRPRTVYFGGGTPTSLSETQLGRLFELLEGRFELSGVEEWTVEADPGTAGASKARFLAGRGVNRVSVGAQTFQPRLLEVLGRGHRAQEAREVVGILRAAGIGNVSLDLMIAIPGQTLDEARRDLDEVLALEPDHISVYCLSWHEGTPYARWREQGRLVPASEDLEADMLEAVVARLAAAGFQRYEISNFARPGRESRHNLAYWTGASYLGLGPGAASFLGGERRTNLRSLEAWQKTLESGGLGVDHRELLGPEAAAREALVVGLRRIAGVGAGEFAARTGFRVDELLGDRGRRLLEGGWLAWDGERLRLTERGLMVADAVMADLV